VRSRDHQTGSPAAAGQPEKIAKLARQDEDTQVARPAADVHASGSDADQGVIEPGRSAAGDVPEAGTKRGSGGEPDRGGRGTRRRRSRPAPRRAWLRESRARGGKIWAAWSAAWAGSTAGRLSARAARQLGSHPGAASAGFARLTVLPAILVTAWLLPGLPLLLAGAFEPFPMLLISVPLAAVLVVIALRTVPSGWPRALPGLRRERARDMWYGLAGTIVVAVGFTIWQLIFRSEAVIVLRDSGAYVQAGFWIAQHGSLPIPQSLAAFGGGHPGLTFSSPGFIASGSSVVPGSVAGLPMLLGMGFWVHGVPAAMAMGPILGGLAVLAFGGLAGRLAGPRWAAAGALVLALTLPEQYTSRAALGETAMQILLFGGLCLVIDAITVNRRARVAGNLAPAGPGPRSQPPAPMPGGAGELLTAGGPEPPPATAQPPLSAEESAEAAAATTRLDPAPGRGDRSRRRRDWGSARGWRLARGWHPARRWRGAGDGRSWPGGPSRGRWRNSLPGANRAAGNGRGRFKPRRAMIALGGLCLGLTSVVQVGGLLDVVPAIAFAGILIARRRAVGIAFSIGLVIGAGYGLAAGYLLARPFMAALKPDPEVIGLIAALLAAATMATVELLRYPRVRGGLRKALSRRPLRWLPAACAIVAVLAVAALALRPYLQTVREAATGAEPRYIGLLQHAEQLRPDPGRTYAEDTLYWVIWYVGAPAILLGAFGLALLVRRCVRALITWRDPAGSARTWALPLAVIAAGAAAVLWNPAITPDQPTASRRLVPLVLPGLIACAIWASAWLVGWARERGASAVAASLVAVCCVAALLVPTAVTTFGLGLTHSGKGGGLRAVANGLALKRIGQGQIKAVSGLCASIRPDSSVIVVDRLVADRFLQVIRGMCNVPAAEMVNVPAADVAIAIAGIGRAGRRPVLIGARARQLAGYGGSPAKVLDLSTTQEPHTLTQPPTTRWGVRYVIWLTMPSGFGVGT
jgi:hypothetical protein